MLRLPACLLVKFVRQPDIILAWTGMTRPRQNDIARPDESVRAGASSP